MAEIAFKDLELQEKFETVEVKVDENTTLLVKQSIPIAQKANLVQFVIDGALDENTGCFSPLRVEVYFSIAVCRWYADVTFDANDIINIDKTYDLLDNSGIIDLIYNNIPSEEMNFVRELTNETVQDISRYNSSAAGIIRSMLTNAEGLDETINSVLESIKNKEGLETLDEIKSVVGTD